jgi:hypothetical protein
VGLVFDLAVIALSLGVTASLLMLAWTLAVSSSTPLRRSREHLQERRAAMTSRVHRIRGSIARADEALRRVASRSAAMRSGR